MSRTYRVLIAEDEQIERLALESKIREIGSHIQLLPSACDGYSLIRSVEKEHPDIAIVDVNMPGLSGLDAIEILKMKHVDMKIIINSSYSDFSYTQKALKLGASDYLLKPSSKEELYSAIHKVCLTLDEERSRLDEQEKNRQAASDLYPIAAEKWIYSLLCGQTDDRCFQLLKKETPALERGGIFTFWKLLPADSLETADTAALALPAQKRISDLLARYIGQYCRFFSAEHHGMQIVFLMTDSFLQKEEAENFIRETIEYTYQQLKKNGYQIFTGVSRFQSNPEQYANALQEARLALLERKRPGISHFQYLPKEAKSCTLQSLPQKVMSLFQKNKKADALALVEQSVLEELSHPDSDFEYLKAQAILFLLRLEELTFRYRSYEKTGWLMWENFYSIKDGRELLSWLLDRTNTFADSQEKEESMYIKKALLYLNENYSKNISLDDVAEQIGISPFYLSRLFKQEKDLTFVELLTDLRIRRAVSMMADSEKTLREISIATGFSSLPYFYRVFKKTTGFTTGEIRQYL